jgi:NAD(P)-dependent dehydrogenase (short-subunit alcohol dehydrogenase family)
MITENYRVDGKVAIVTGAGRGMGKAIALTLAEAGADVVVVARTAKQIEQTAEEIRKLGRKALAIPTDVAREDQVKAAVEQTISQFGKIDILCNNAGIVLFKPVAVLPGVRLPAWETAGDNWDKPCTLDDWHRVIDNNLTSAFLFAQAVGPHMMRQKKGKVVITSATGAEEGFPYLSAYCVSKAGLSEFTRCLAAEWGPFNINVNAVAPGMIITSMSQCWVEDAKIREHLLKLIPLGRLGEPRDVALLALFLASEASDYISGQVFTIDGGAMGQGCGI